MAVAAAAVRAAAAAALPEAVPAAAAAAAGTAVPDCWCPRRQPRTLLCQPLLPAAAAAADAQEDPGAGVGTAAADVAVVGPASAAVAADGDLSHEQMQRQGRHCQKPTNWWCWPGQAHLLPPLQVQVQQKHPSPLRAGPLAMASLLSQPVAHPRC